MPWRWLYVRAVYYAALRICHGKAFSGEIYSTYQRQARDPRDQLPAPYAGVRGHVDGLVSELDQFKTQRNTFSEMLLRNRILQRFTIQIEKEHSKFHISDVLGPDLSQARMEGMNLVNVYVLFLLNYFYSKGDTVKKWLIKVRHFCIFQQDF